MQTFSHRYTKLSFKVNSHPNEFPGIFPGIIRYNEQPERDQTRE